jgi:hypothetical protein
MKTRRVFWRISGFGALALAGLLAGLLGQAPREARADLAPPATTLQNATPGLHAFAMKVKTASGAIGVNSGHFVPCEDPEIRCTTYTGWNTSYNSPLCWEDVDGTWLVCYGSFQQCQQNGGYVDYYYGDICVDPGTPPWPVFP